MGRVSIRRVMVAIAALPYVYLAVLACIPAHPLLAAIAYSMLIPVICIATIAAPLWSLIFFGEEKGMYACLILGSLDVIVPCAVVVLGVGPFRRILEVLEGKLWLLVPCLLAANVIALLLVRWLVEWLSKS